MNEPADQSQGHTEYLSPGEVAKLFHVNTFTVSTWAKAGKLPFILTLGGHRRYPKKEVLELAKETPRST